MKFWDAMLGFNGLKINTGKLIFREILWDKAFEYKLHLILIAQKFKIKIYLRKCSLID